MSFDQISTVVLKARVGSKFLTSFSNSLGPFGKQHQAMKDSPTSIKNATKLSKLTVG